MAKLPIDIHPQAHLEEEEAFDYYCQRNVRAAIAFHRELEKARHAIQNSPEAWGQYLYGTRYYRLKRFPYLVVYRVSSHRIEVVAIAHGRRKSGYWAERLRPNA